MTDYYCHRCGLRTGMMGHDCDGKSPTGRSTTKEIEFHDLPSAGAKIRRSVEALRDLTGTDYSTLEARVLAHELGKIAKEIPDPHVTEAMKIFGVPQDKVTPLMRKAAKTVNYIKLYSEEPK